MRTENFYDDDICRYDDARTAVDTAVDCDEYVQPESPADDVEDQYLQPVVDDAQDDDALYTDATHPPQRAQGIASYVELLDDYRDYSN